MADFPLHPRLARLLVDAAERAAEREGADLAALLRSETFACATGSFPTDCAAEGTCGLGSADRVELLE